MAAVGLRQNSVAIIIEAMVIAPLLGPNVALALGTTLGDLSLLRRALLTAVAGVATAMALSAILGVILRVDPALSEVMSRTRVDLGEIAVALASGSAGALAFTTGVSATLIGVMVAVALLPPLVTFRLLLGGGHLDPGDGGVVAVPGEPHKSVPANGRSLACGSRCQSASDSPACTFFWW